jgi:hypothetical protein
VAIRDDSVVAIVVIALPFPVTWSNWRELLDRVARCFGQSDESFPKTCVEFISGCDESSREALLPERIACAIVRSVIFDQNERLLKRRHELPRLVLDQVWVYLRHYLHSVLGVSRLVDSTPGVSALLSISWRKQPMSVSLQWSCSRTAGTRLRFRRNIARS